MLDSRRLTGATVAKKILIVSCDVFQILKILQNPPFGILYAPVIKALAGNFYTEYSSFLV